MRTGFECDLEQSPEKLLLPEIKAEGSSYAEKQQTEALYLWSERAESGQKAPKNKYN